MSLTFKSIKLKLQNPILFRLLCAILVPTILVSLSISFGARIVHKQVAFTQKEIRGVQAVHHLFDAVIDLQVIRGLSNITSQAELPSFATQRQAAVVKFNNHFKDPQWQKLLKEFAIEKQVEHTLRAVNSLGKPKYQNLSNKELFERYTSSIESLYSIMLVVADRSNLILDPELDTYYLMEIAIKQIPDLCEAFGIIRGLGSGVIAHGGAQKNDQKVLREKVSIARSQLKKFERTLLIIKEATPNSSSPYVDNENVLNQASASFLQTCQSLADNKLNISANTFFSQSSDTIFVFADIFHRTIGKLENRLEKRLNDQLGLLQLTLLGLITSIIAIFYFSLSSYRLLKNSHQELERISITDPLTSIPNRRHLDTVFARETQRARRDSNGFAFGLMDIDFFKGFNDTYGHHEGDVALKKVAQALQNTLQRAGDHYFRFGGEEFCFLLNAQTIVETKEIGERIRVAIEQLEIEHSESSISDFLTISLGIIFVPKITTENLNEIITLADDLLYEAKDIGRNQCISRTLTS